MKMIEDSVVMKILKSYRDELLTELKFGQMNENTEIEAEQEILSWHKQEVKEILDELEKETRIIIFNQLREFVSNTTVNIVADVVSKKILSLREGK